MACANRQPLSDDAGLIPPADMNPGTLRSRIRTRRPGNLGSRPHIKRGGGGGGAGRM